LIYFKEKTNDNKIYNSKQLIAITLTDK